MEGAAGMSAIVTAVTSGVTDIGEQALTAIGAVVPSAILIMGSMVIVGIAIRAFKKVANK